MEDHIDQQLKNGYGAPRFKEMRKSLTILSLLIVCISCSYVKTYIPKTAKQDLKNLTDVHILVRTGHPGLDKIVYEFAFINFQDLLPLAEKRGEGSVLEITFASSSESAFVSSTSTVSSVNATATGWYDGHGYWGGSGYATGTSTTFNSGSTMTWQNSTMIIVLKNNSAKRLWTADYKYKGGWEMSGYSVNTADEAARLLVERLAKRFKSDFGK